MRSPVAVLLLASLGSAASAGALASEPDGGLGPTPTATTTTFGSAEKAENVITPRSQIEAQALLLEYEQALRSFERAGLSMRDEVRGAIKAEANRRIRYIQSLYATQEQALDADQNKLRADAIHLFTRFIRRYPDQPKHTPDAMFRLAELQYEEAEVAYIQDQDQHEENLDLYRRGKIADEPRPPEKDYGKVIATLDSLVERFPRYRFAAAAHYLLGFTLLESGEDERGRQVYLSLAEHFPKSRFAPEALLRLGELEFDLANFEVAAQYYARVLEFAESSFFDLALYKLAWSYYQVFDYPRAIETFKKLIAHYDQRRAKNAGKSKGNLAGREGQLRSEAIEYVAKALAEDDWDGDGEPEADSGPERALRLLSGGTPYEREILAMYAQVLFDLHDMKKYPDAIAIYRKLIADLPTDPENPRFQERIIAIYDELRDFEGSAEARQEMAQSFGRGSRWFSANSENGEALERASLVVEIAMHQRAQFHHLRAQELRVEGRSQDDPEKIAASVREYRRAADAYAAYLERYPNSSKRSEVLYYRAEALYYGGSYTEAAGDYGKVRDLKDARASRFRNDAGFSAIKSYERAVDLAVDAGRLPQKASPEKGGEVEEVEMPTDKSGQPTRAVPEPIPPLVRAWIDAIDRFIELKLVREGDPDATSTFAYQAAEMLYRFRDFEGARARLSAILDTWPTSDVAHDAAGLVINSYKVENDWENLQKWAAIIEQKKVGRPEEQARLREAIRIFRLGARFKTAEQLLAKKEFLKAAQEFERLADQPGVQFADKALYNAAMAYKEVKHYDKAARAFEKILTENRFRKSHFRELALFQVAENSKKFFDFDRAISSYLALYRGNEGNDNSPYALFEAAKLLENDDQFEKAAELFEEYARVYRNRDDATFAYFRAANAWRSAKASRREQANLKTFVDKARAQTKLGGYVIESLVRIGKHAMTRNAARDARRHFDGAISLYQARQYPPGSPEADFAAQARFEIEELQLRTYRAIELRGTLKQMGRSIQRAQQMIPELIRGYQEVFAYRAYMWTFAAYYRIGEIHQEFAQKLYSAPEPKGLNAEELDIYRTQLEDEGAKWEDTAVARYEEMIRQARRLKVTNEWVNKALIFLNKYKPQDYPLAKEEKEIFVWDEAWSLHGGAAAGAGTETAPSPETEGGAP